MSGYTQDEMKEHKRLCFSLSRNLTDMHVKHIKDSLEDFGQGELEKLHDFSDIYRALESRALVTPGNYAYLKDILNFVGCENCVTIIEETENKCKWTSQKSNGLRFRKAQQESTPKNVETPTIERNPKREYPVDRERTTTGQVLIINQFTDTRRGTVADVMSLKSFFAKVKMNVIIHNNLTKKGVMKVLEEVAQLLKTDSSERFVCVILSHGNKAGVWACKKDPSQDIYVKEEQINVDDEILPIFNTANIPEMMHKPKVFLIQACRGLEYSVGVQADDAVAVQPEDESLIIGDTECDAEPFPMFVPNEADFLVAYPQTKGYKSYRDTIGGSWFIQEVIRVFQEYYKEEDVISMLTMVNESVSERFYQDPKSKMIGVQMPCFMSTLRRKLYL